jgi:hypothetical protein
MGFLCDDCACLSDVDKYFARFFSGITKIKRRE